MNEKESQPCEDFDMPTFGSALRRVYGRSKTVRDADGQPHASYRKPDVTRRQIDELIGSLRGIMADGDVVPKEVIFLKNWIENNPYAAAEWPASALHSRITCALKDGQLDDDELNEIYSLIAAIIGDKSGDLRSGINSTTLPLTNPAPLIRHSNSFFCFTGKLFWGKRSEAEDLVVKLGGGICGVSNKLNYLVLGEIGSRDWLHSTHGLKIKRALEMIQEGHPLSIVSEQHWASSIPSE